MDFVAAGAWGTIFAANQMASQAYRMKINQVKEFCRLKGLDYGVKAKLVAFYEHLFPENVIVDEAEIISDLPPRMVRSPRINVNCRVCGNTVTRALSCVCAAAGSVSEDSIRRHHYIYPNILRPGYDGAD